MRPSDRIAGINGGGSDGWEVLYQARDLRRAGDQVLDLTIGDHDWTTPDVLIDAMTASARKGQTGYAPITGYDALRSAIAERVVTRTGVPTGLQNVIVVQGGQAGLFASMMATLDPGDRALVMDPYYATYPGTIRAASGIPEIVPTRAEAGFQPQAADLAAAAPAKSILINSPNNPSGSCYTPETMATLARFAIERDMWVISDEVYEGQVWNGTHLTARAIPGLRDRTLVIGSLSKSHVMTGWRLGWIVGPPDMISAFCDLATNTTYGVPGFIQDAALTALTEDHGIEDETAAKYRTRRRATFDVLAGQNSVQAAASDGGMYVMLDIRSTGLSGQSFAQALLAKHRVAVMPGESFGTACAGHVRVALTRPANELTQAITTISKFAEETR